MVSGHKFRINQIALGPKMKKSISLWMNPLMMKITAKNVSAKPQNTERPKRGGILLEKWCKSL